MRVFELFLDTEGALGHFVYDSYLSFAGGIIVLAMATRPTGGKRSHITL
jgi:hypothetical protein